VRDHTAIGSCGGRYRKDVEAAVDGFFLALPAEIQMQERPSPDMAISRPSLQQMLRASKVTHVE
jgi:hypothetical protein